MKITVLAANSVCKTNSLNFKTENGLSLLIEFYERKILFNSWQADLFIHNAEKMGIDLSQVDYLVISHGHFDYGSSLKHFLKINKKAKIFLHINASHKFYMEVFGFIPYYVGIDQMINAYKSRIYFIEEDTQIDDKIILLEGFTEVFPKPEVKKALFEKTKNRFNADKFNHELAMLLIEYDEVVLFSGCSHSGIINLIEEVKLLSKNMRIKAKFGSFHINNPISKKNESQDYIKELTEAICKTDSVFYTGHYTRENKFLYIKGLMCRKIQKMSIGEVIEV
jgi:7,8-dihydropterin-6-yl-methyl-4-(beta-D-ribofuranosyl)aminobenzene 5'-phosphate synthase